MNYFRTKLSFDLMKIETEMLKYSCFWNEWYECFKVVPDHIVYFIVFIFTVKNDYVAACLICIDVFKSVEKSIGSMNKENIGSSDYIAENDAENFMQKRIWRCVIVKK